MVPTWFLSMWISNTAATSMMLPIIRAVIKTLEEVQEKGRRTDYLSRLVKKPTMWFPSRSDTNRAVQAEKMARD